MPWKPLVNDHIQFNAALESDSSFIVVPGSHRRSMLAKEREILERDPCGEPSGQLRVELEPGDMVIMDAHALHRGEAPRWCAAP